MDSDFFPEFFIDSDSNDSTVLQKVYNIKNKKSREFFTTNVDLTENTLSFNDLLSSEKDEKCNMDTEPVNPREICVVNINDIEFPWLIEDSEVITPFCHPQSFLDAHIGFRQRLTPKSDMDSDTESFLNDETLKKLESFKLNTQSVRSTVSTPVEETKQIAMRVEISKTHDISAIKEKLCQAVEDAMEKNLSMADIKILIKFNKNVEDLPKESSVEGQMNDSTENESCQSFSSKENYCFKHNEENIPNFSPVQVKFSGHGSHSDDSQEKREIFQGEVTIITGSNSSSKKKKLKKRRHLRNLAEELHGSVTCASKKEGKMLSTTNSGGNGLALVSNVIPEDKVEINNPSTIAYSETEIIRIEQFENFSLEESTENTLLPQALPLCNENSISTKSICLEHPKIEKSDNQKDNNISSFLLEEEKRSIGNEEKINQSEQEVVTDNKQLNSSFVEENTSKTTLGQELCTSFVNNDEVIDKTDAIELIDSTKQEVISKNDQSGTNFVEGCDQFTFLKQFSLVSDNDTSQNTVITNAMCAESQETPKFTMWKSSIGKNISLSEPNIVSSSDNVKKLSTKSLLHELSKCDVLVEQSDTNLIKSTETNSSGQIKPISSTESICLKSPKKAKPKKLKDNTMMAGKTILLEDLQSKSKSLHDEHRFLAKSSEMNSDDIIAPISEITPLFQNLVDGIKATSTELLNLENTRKRKFRKGKDQVTSSSPVEGTTLLPANEEKPKESVIPNPAKVLFAENDRSSLVKVDSKITSLPQSLTLSLLKTSDSVAETLAGLKKRKRRRDSSNSTFLKEDNIISFADNRVTRHSFKRDSSSGISAEDISTSQSENNQSTISSVRNVDDIPDKGLPITTENGGNIGLTENNTFTNDDQDVGRIDKMPRLKQTEIGTYLINLKSVECNSLNKNATNQELEPFEKPVFEEKHPSNVQNTVADVCNESFGENNAQICGVHNFKMEIKNELNDNSLPLLGSRVGRPRKRSRKRKLKKTGSALQDCFLNVRVLISPMEIAERQKMLRNENKDFTLGTFVWAAVSRFPYWPAIICDDPVTHKFFYSRVINKIRHTTTNVKYHVRFFGDGGRRAWVTKSHLMVYYSREDLDMVANKLKLEGKGSSKQPKPYLVPRSVHPKWDVAVEEIEQNRCKPYNEVIKFLLRSSSEYRRQKVKSKVVATQISPETSAEDLGPATKKAKLDTSQTTAEESACSLLPTPEVSNEMDVSVSILQDDSHNMSEIANISSSTKVQDVDNIPDNIETIASCLSAEENLLDNHSPRRSRRSLKMVQRINMLELRENSFTSDVSGNFENLSAAEDLSAEGVETSAIEKKEDHTKKRQKLEIDPNIYSFKYQMDLHKRNNLFNGLRNTKVCDYCFKLGDKLYKCKGRCGGLSFHLDCLPNVTKPLLSRINRKKDSAKSCSKLNNSRQDSVPIKTEDGRITRSQNLSSVEIVTVKSKHFSVATPSRDNLPDNYSELPVADQIDLRMEALMSKYDGQSMYQHDSTDSEAGSTEGRSPGGTSSEESTLSTPDPTKIRPSDSPVSTVCSDGSNIDDEDKSSGNAELLLTATNTVIRHITADSEIPVLADNIISIDLLSLKCAYCLQDKDPPCFSCGLEVSRKGETARQKCSQSRCGRFFHLGCIKHWPQTKWAIGRWSKDETSDFFTCPTHACHTCFAEDLGSAFAGCRLPGDRLAKCVLCPVAFHTSTFCIPAGSEILGGSQIICPKHRTTPIQPINTIWCFICSKGGKLVCCENCPTSVHCECQPNLRLDDDDRYICEDCESGRFPLYDEIVWVKLGHYRWWPAVILFPNEVPVNVKALRKHRGDFAVQFFGTNDHYWVNKGRVFLFQEDDKGGSPSDAKLKKKVALIFEKAVAFAKIAYKLKKEFKVQREALCVDVLKPPPYVRINKNKPVGNVKSSELNLSNTTACDCDPNRSNPCGPDSNCINRILLTECDPQLCRAGDRCCNQSFQKRDYPPLAAYSTQGRGWGLKCLGPIKKGQFIIEYVGELIDSEEYQRRIQQMHDKKEENYYFMTVDSERVIDAGPKGNLSRFMNHSCNPNCITQKWTVKGDTKVGLFSKYDIEPESELTFNYNLAVVGQEKKPCKCGAINCSGFIGVKPEKADSLLLPLILRKPRKYSKKRAPPAPGPPPPPRVSEPCFKCNRKKTHITCFNKACHKSFHLKCVNLDEMPDASAVAKFSCPRHNCVICSNRTIRCCVVCMNAYCPNHSEGNMRYCNFRGYVCLSHESERSVVEPTEKTAKRKRSNDQTDEAVSSTTEENISGIEPSTPNPRPKFKRSDYCYEEVDMSVSSSPLKYLTDESTSTSSVEEDLELSLKQRLKKLKMRNRKEKIRISVGGLCGRFKGSKSNF